jgi:SH3 domain
VLLLCVFMLCRLPVSMCALCRVYLMVQCLPSDPITRCRALYDYDAQDEGELSFKADDVIVVYEKDESGWVGECRVDAVLSTSCAYCVAHWCRLVVLSSALPLLRSGTAQLTARAGRW